MNQLFRGTYKVPGFLLSQITPKSRWIQHTMNNTSWNIGCRIATADVCGFQSTQGNNYTVISKQRVEIDHFGCVQI